MNAFLRNVENLKKNIINKMSKRKLVIADVR